MANKKKQDEALAAVQAQTEESGLSAAQSGYSAAGLGSRAEVENALANASYKPSQTVTSAENALKEWQTNRPDDYESRYQDKIDQLLGQLLQRESFQYSYTKDPLYRQYEQNYLQNAHNAHNDFLHAGIRLMENLNGAFLGNLGNALFKLLAFHGVGSLDGGEMLRCKGRNALKLHLMALVAHGIADGENTRVEHADNISRISLVNDRPVVCHQLLRLGVVDTAFAMEPSDIKSFRILEDGEVLYEGEKGNFRSYKSNIKERLDELKPRIDE